MKKIIILLIFLLPLVSCGGDEEDELKYSLKVSTSISDGGIVNPSQGSYIPGTVVSLKSTPSEYHYFKEWRGDADGQINPITIVMDSDKFVTAVFELKDTDKDGLTDDVDQCPDSQIGDLVDENGCKLKDTDEDGILDTHDQCPDTLTGAAVDDNGCAILPVVSVNQTIFLNDPEYINLQVVGGWAYSSGGISGIIIYHYSTNSYIAFERSAPHLSAQYCSKMTVKNGIIMFCSCDDSEFNILNGAPLTDGIEYSARQYRVSLVNSSTLQITNF